MKRYYINYITIIIIITFLGNNFAYSQPSTSFKSPAKKPAGRQVSSLKSNFRLDIHIPESYGTIERSIVYAESPMVILLRDAHCNYEAQYNLVNILKHLSIEVRQKEPLLVAVEGASGPMDLTQFSEFPDKDAKEKALDEFVRKGYVTGPQFLKIVEKENIPLEIYGVETPQLYTENYRAFRSVLDRKESLAYIEKLSGIAKELKQKHYSQELLDLDENAAAYRNNELNLADWVKYLYRNQKPVTSNQKNFNFVLQSLKLEAQIDFKEVEEERTRLIKLLEKVLVKEDLKELVSQSLLFRLGKISAKRYYSCLEERIDVPERYPWLLKYIQLVQIQGKIDSHELFKELEQIEFQIKEGLFRNETERKLDKISYNLYLLSKLYRLEFTNSEWDYYREHINEFDLNKIASILKSQVPSLKPQAPPKDKPEGQASMPAEDFYKTALERDNALVDNTLRLMEDKNHLLAALITGGFHTDGIAQRLKEKKISHIIISPKISKVQEDSPYLGIMLDPRMANPLEFSREIKSQIWQRLKDYVKGDLLSEELSSGEIELIKNAIQTTDLQLARELLLKLLPVWERSFVLGEEASANFSVQKNLAVPDLVSAGNPLLGDLGPDSAAIGKLKDWEGNIITQHIRGKIVRRGDKRYLELYDRRKSHTKPLMRIRCRKEHIKEEMVEDLSVALSSVRIPTGSIAYKYIDAIIKYISDSDRRFYVLEEDIDSFYGFANASIFCLFRPFLSLSPAFFHEGGEGFFLSRAYRHFLEQELGHELTVREWAKYRGKARVIVDGEEVLITAHTYLRGLGKKARVATRSLTEDEQLLPEGKGLEDWLFGPENLSVSQMISEQKEITRMLESAEEEEWVQKVLPELRQHRKFFPYGSNREVIAFLKDLIQVSSVSKLLDLCMNQLLRPSTDNPNLGLNLFDCLEEIEVILELLKKNIPYAKPQKDVGLLMKLIAKMKGGYRDVKGKGVVSKNLEPWKKNLLVMKGLVRFFNRIEKAELHHHLDGAISPELILKILCLFPEARKEFVRNVLQEKGEDINRVFADKIGGPKETRDWDILESRLQYLFTAREENRENREQSFIEIFGGVREYKKAVEKIRRYLVYEPESAGTLNIVEFLRKFTLTGIVLYSNPEALRIVAREATLETYRSDNVTLVEQKIHNLTNGTPLGTIVRKVLQGLREAEAISKGKIRTGLVVSIFKNPDIVLGGKERYEEVVRLAKEDSRSIEEIKAAILEDVRSMLEEDYRDDMQLAEMYFKEEERELEEALMQICSPADLLVFYEVRKAGIRQVREIIDVKKDLTANYPELGKRLIGIDTVGSEIGHTAWAHSYSLRLAKKHGFRVADHAGESWPEEDIWQALYRIKGAIETGAVERIGHATALGIHPEALRESVWSDGTSKGKPIYSLDEIGEIEKLQRTILKMAKDKGIVIETNPSSNHLLMPKYITTYSRHPIRYFWKRLRGSLVISSDDPHILGTIGLRGELARVWLAHPKFKFGELLQIVKNGFEHSFIPKQEETPASKDGAIGKGSCVAEKDSVPTYKLWEEYYELTALAIDRLKRKVSSCTSLTDPEREIADHVIKRLEEYFARGLSPRLDLPIGGKSAGGGIVWFRSLVETKEDYLLAFHDTRYDQEKESPRDQIAVMEELFRSNHPLAEHLEEVLFHEGYAAEFGEPDYEAHQKIYGKVDLEAGIDYSASSIQRKIFGENLLGPALREDYIDYIADNQNDYEIVFDERTRRNQKIRDNLSNIEKLLKDKKFVYDAIGGGSIDFSIPIEKINVYEGGQGSQKQTLHVEVITQGDGTPRTWRFALKVAINKAAREGFAKSKLSEKEEIKEIDTLEKISGKCKIPGFGCYVADPPNNFYAYTEAWIEGPTVHQLMARGKLTTKRLTNMVGAYLSVMKALDIKKVRSTSGAVTDLHIGEEVEGDDVVITYLAIRDVQPENVMFMAWPPREIASHVVGEKPEDKAVCVDIGKIEYVKPLFILQEFDRHYGKSKGTEEEQERWRKATHKAIFDGVLSSLGKTAGRHFLEEAFNTARRDRRQLKGYSRKEADLLADSLREYLEVLCIQEIAEKISGGIHRLSLSILQNLAKLKQNPEDTSILQNILQDIKGVREEIFIAALVRAEKLHEADSSEVNTLELNILSMFINSLDSVSGGNLKQLLDALSSGITSRQDSDSMLDILINILQISFLLKAITKSRRNIRFIEEPDGAKRINLLSIILDEVGIPHHWASHSYSTDEILDLLEVGEDDVYLSLGGGPGIMNIGACLRGVRRSIYLDVSPVNIPLVVGLKANYAWIERSPGLSTNIKRQANLKAKKILEWIERLKRGSGKEPLIIVPPLQIIQADAAEIPLPDNSVSKISILDLLHHIEGQGGYSKVFKVIRNVLRIVKPGGLLLIRPNTPGYGNSWKLHIFAIAILMGVELRFEGTTPIGAMLFRVGSKKTLTETIDGPEDTTTRYEEEKIDDDGAIGKGSCLAEKDSVGVKRLDYVKRTMVRNAIDEIKTKIAEAVALGRLAGDDLDRAKQIIDRLEEYFAGGDIVWFDALVKNPEDYLLAFYREKDNVISLMNEFFQPDFPIPLYSYMAEVLFHEGYTSLFGEPDYDAHRSIYLGIQRKVFGEENPLKELLRKFIEHRCSNGKWSDEINGILYIREALEREKPLLYRQYLRIEELDEDEKELLREEFYKIGSGHFLAWGLKTASVKEWTPYFDGSHIDALIKSFPALGLNPLGFSFCWDTEENGIRSVHYAVRKERPLLYRQYLNIENLSEPARRALRKEFYKIIMAHFKVWELQGAMDRRVAPYFNGSYITALIKSFPELGLEPLGFGLKWDTEQDGIGSVRYIISKEKPLLYEKYLRIDNLLEDDVERLRKEFLEITKAHFMVWGLGSAMIRTTAPYFGGSYKEAIIKTFPKLGLRHEDFETYRRSRFQKRFRWRDVIEGVENIKVVIEQERPDLFNRYSRLDQFSEDEIELLREDFYKIKHGHFGLWGLNGALNSTSAPYFEGSHAVALIKSFPGLCLNPLGFELKWRNKKEGRESIHYVIRRERPLLYRQYSNISNLTEDEKELLREEFYKITSGHFDLWGLRKARKPQHFGSHITALIESFPSLDLNPLGFELKWGSLQEGIESVRYVVKRERPLLYRRYLDLENFGERERRLIKEEFYKITAAYFSIWGLDTAMNRRLAPYFNGSHIDALIKSFPSLGLEKEGFLDKEDRVYIKKRGEEFKVADFADRGEFFRRAGRELDRKVGGYMVSGDVDHLNKLNKVYGKPIMTHILIEIRQTILDELNRISGEEKLKGILFHASADEFLVYLPGMLKVNDVEDILNRVRRRVEEVLTGKYAVAEVNVDELTVDQLSKLRGSVSVIDSKERRRGNLVLVPLEDTEKPKAALDRINSSLGKNALSFNWFDHGETFNNGYLWVPTVSIGAVPVEAVRVAKTPEGMSFLMYLINRAEDSLQEAKKTRNTVCVGLYRQHIHMGGEGAYLNQHAEEMLAQIEDRVSIPPDERDGLIPFFYKEEAFRRRVDNDVKEGRSGTLIQIEPFYGGSIIEEKTQGLTKEERTELYRGSPLGIGLRGVNELCGHLAGDAAIRALALAIILNELVEDWQMVVEIDEDSSMHIERGIPTDRFVDRFKIWVVKKDGTYVSKHEAAAFIDRVQEVANGILDKLKIAGMQISVAQGVVNVTGELFERVDDTSLVTRGADVYITENGNIVKAYTPEVDRRAVELNERTAQEKVRILRQVKDKEFMDLYNRLQESVSNLGWKLLPEEELRLLFLGERQTAYPTLIDAFRADGVVTEQEVELAKVMAGIVAEATEGMGLKKEERLRMAELLTILGISESEAGFSKEFMREYRRRLREQGYEDKISEMIELLEEMRDTLKPNPETGELMPLDLYYYLYIAELEELLGMDIFSAIRESYFRKQAYKILKLVGLDNKQVLEAVLNWYHGEPLPDRVRQILGRSAYMDTSVGVHNLLEFFIRQMKLLEYSMQFFRDVKHFHKGAGAPETRSRVHEAARIINLNGKLVNLAESGDLVVKRYDNVMAVYDDNGDEVMSFDLDLLDTWMNGSALFSRLVVPKGTRSRLGDVIDLADKVLAESGKVQAPEDAFSKKPSGVIAQDIDDVFSINGLTALNGKIRVEFSDLSPGLKSWLEGLRRSIKGLDASGLKFAYIGKGLDEIVQLDGLIVTKRDIIKQLIKDYSDIDPDSIYLVSDIEEIEEENIVYLGSKLDTDRLREERIKFVVKNDTGLPIELSWCLIMLGLKVYNDDGSLSEEVISVYTQFVDILVHAELIDGSIAQEIIGEVRRTGCIKLPAVRRIREILEEIRRYKLYIDIAA